MSFNDPDSATAGSVTLLIQKLRKDGRMSTDELWQRYYERLLPVARSRLRALRNPAIDEEDVLISVFDRFFRAAFNDKFAELKDRNDLWQILLMLIDREVSNQFRRANAAKRPKEDVADLNEPREHCAERLQGVSDHQPKPELVTIFNDCLAQIVRKFDDTSLRDIALNRLEGYTNQEIANRLHISLTSVERKLRMIREAWIEAFE